MKVSQERMQKLREAVVDARYRVSEGNRKGTTTRSAMNRLLRAEGALSKA